MRRILGIPGESPETPGTSGDHPCTPLGPPRTPLGFPGTPLGPPQTTKTAMSSQIYSARSSRLLHPNPFATTHHSKDPPGPFYHVYFENGALLVGHRAAPVGLPQGRPGGEPLAPRNGRTPMGKESTHMAPEPGSYLYIYVHVMYIYTYRYVGKTLVG